MAVCLPRFATRSSSLHVLAESIEKKISWSYSLQVKKGVKRSPEAAVCMCHQGSAGAAVCAAESWPA